MFGCDPIYFLRMDLLRLKNEEKSDREFQDRISGLSPENKLKMIEKRNKFKLDERRHQELCGALMGYKRTINIRNIY